MDFMNLAEVPEVETVQDGDTVFVVRNGEVCRVAKDKVGGGGYIVNVGSDEVTESGSVLVITTPIPGMLEAVASGAAVTLAVDAGLLMSGSETGVPMYISILYMADAAVMDEAYSGMDGAVAGYSIICEVLFTNGQAIPDTASATALSLDDETTPSVSLLDKLRSKLGGGNSDQL